MNANLWFILIIVLTEIGGFFVHWGFFVLTFLSVVVFLYHVMNATRPPEV